MSRFILSRLLMSDPNHKEICQSCSMPLPDEKLKGNNADGSKSDAYCQYCYDGGEFTNPNITLDEMIYHSKSVVRAVQRALVVTDLPFGTYQGNSKLALASAIRMTKETGSHSVKMEGGEEIKKLPRKKSMKLLI